jgi:hypothetical protein
MSSLFMIRKVGSVANSTSRRLDKLLNYGDLIDWHTHVHVVVSDGVFSKNGNFINASDVNLT